MELGWGKVLLVKDNGEFHALGHKCPHYGAPLVKGELSGSPEVGVAMAPLSPSTTRPSPAGLLPGPPVPHLLVGCPGLCGRASRRWDTGNLGKRLLQVTPAQHRLPAGVLSRGRVRCPWHGACFNISTGDLEDFPGLDSLHKFQVGWVCGGWEPRGSGSGTETPKAWF